MNNLLESYLIPSTQNHGLTMIGCIAVNACYEKETYDTLTICNAVYKLTKTFFIGDYNQKTTEK